jgi:hypothetical protein
MSDPTVTPINSRTAAALVVQHHYLHRRPSISYAFGFVTDGAVAGVVTYGVPASRHLQLSACPQQPGAVIELNRLWLHDDLPANSESWFVSRTLRLLPPRIVVSYADPKHGHYGYIYRALNFNYAGWTDMERKSRRWDYIPLNPKLHSREAGRSGHSHRVQRIAKVRYWTVTGTRSDRRRLSTLCEWPSLDWRELPPPAPDGAPSVDLTRSRIPELPPTADGQVALWEEEVPA